MALKQPIELHIEELVLHGFPPHQAYQIGRIVEEELGRLFYDRGLPPMLSQEGNFKHLSLSPLELGNEVDAKQIGSQIAQTLYQGFQLRNAS